MFAEQRPPLRVAGIGLQIKINNNILLIRAIPFALYFSQLLALKLGQGLPILLDHFPVYRSIFSFVRVVSRVAVDVSLYLRLARQQRRRETARQTDVISCTRQFQLYKLLFTFVFTFICGITFASGCAVDVQKSARLIIGSKSDRGTRAGCRAFSLRVEIVPCLAH